MYQKACYTCKVVVLRNKPIAFLTSSLRSPSSFHGSRRYADDYIQRPGREFKKTDGLKTFLDYVAKYSSPEHYLVTELRKVGKDFMQYFLL